MSKEKQVYLDDREWCLLCGTEVTNWRNHMLVKHHLALSESPLNEDGTWKHEKYWNRTPSPESEEGMDSVSLCSFCHCATHTIGGKCGKCGHTKPTADVGEETRDIQADFDKLDEIGGEVGTAVPSEGFYKGKRMVSASDYATLRKANEELLEQELDRKAEILDMKTKLAEAETVTKQDRKMIFDLQNWHEQDEAKLATLRKENEEYKAKVVKCCKENCEGEINLPDKLEGLEKGISSLEFDNKNYIEAINDMATELATLRKENEEVEKRIVEANDAWDYRFNEVCAENKALRKENEELESRIAMGSEHGALLDESNIREADLQAQLAKAGKESQRLSAQLTTSVQEVTGLRSTLVNQKGINHRLNDKLTEAEKGLATMTATVAAWCPERPGPPEEWLAPTLDDIPYIRDLKERNRKLGAVADCAKTFAMAVAVNAIEDDHSNMHVAIELIEFEAQALDAALNNLPKKGN